MNQLAEVLALIRERLSRYKGQPIGEQNTKAVLIVPVLRALGWDVEDLDEVQMEYRRSSADSPVDFALFILRSPRLFVEAKALGENLDDRRWASQIMGYAGVAGVEWVVLTDGDEWRIYNAHAVVPIEEKLFRAARLTDDIAGTAETLELLSKEQIRENLTDLLWKSDFVDRQIRGAIEGLFGPEPDPALVKLIARRVPTLPSKDVKAGLSRVRVTLDFPGAPIPTGEKRPAATATAKSQRDASREAEPRGRRITLLDLINAGLIQTPLELEGHSKGESYWAQVESDGTMVWHGRPYNAPSSAASVAVGYSEDGWRFWQFRDQDGQLKYLDELRKRYVGAQKPTGLDIRERRLPG